MEVTPKLVSHDRAIIDVVGADEEAFGPAVAWTTRALDARGQLAKRLVSHVGELDSDHEGRAFVEVVRAFEVGERVDTQPRARRAVRACPSGELTAITKAESATRSRVAFEVGEVPERRR